MEEKALLSSTNKLETKDGIMYFCINCSMLHTHYETGAIVYQTGFRYVDGAKHPVGFCSEKV